VHKRAIGDIAEEQAVKYLQKLGFRIMARNYQIRGGEIDIIATDKGELVFIEVKFRTSDQFGIAREAIGYHKLQSLIHSARFYVAEHYQKDIGYRLDLLAIDQQGDDWHYELIKNITS
jgi:putative endonuclease